MTASRRKTGHLAMATAVLSFVAIGIAIPIVVGGSDRIELHSASLVAAPRDRHSITSPLTLQGVRGLTVERGTISLSEKHQDKTTSGESTAALLASGGARLVLEGATIVLDQSAGANADEPPAGSLAPLAIALSDLNFDGLSIRRSTLVRRGHDGRTRTLGEVNADITAKRRASLAAKGTLTVRGQKVAFETSLGLSGERQAAPRPQPLRLTVKGPLIEATVDGAIAAGGDVLQAQSEISVRNARDLARWFGLGWPAGPGFADLKIKGPMIWSREAIAFQKASMQMDGNEAIGSLSFTYADRRPNVSGTLALQSLDLGRYVREWQREATRSLLDDVMGQGPFALPLVRLIDADIRISANRVRTGGQDLSQCAATLTLRKGKLAADFAEIAIDEARASGQLIIDATGAEPRFVVRGKATGLDVARLAPEAAGIVPVRGKGDLVADVSATGSTSYDLLRTLNGKLSVTMPQGARVGLDLRALLASAHKEPFNGWGHLGRGSTSVDNLHGRLVVSEGVIYTESFSAAVGDALVTARGGGNLRNGQVDLRLSMAGKPPAAERSPQTAAPLIDELVLRGPWHEPHFRAERNLPSATGGPAAMPATAPASRRP